MDIRNKLPEKQQDDYDIFVSQGKMIAMRMADKLNTAGDPVKILADALLGIVNKVRSEGSRNGLQFDPLVMAAGSVEILTVLLMAAGIELNDEQIRQTVGQAIGQFVQQALDSGEIDNNQLQQAAMVMQQKGGKNG